MRREEGATGDEIRPPRGCQAGDEGPAGPAHELQGEDGSCQGRSEHGGEASRDAAEKERASGARTGLDPAGAHIGDASAHLHGGAFSSDRRSAQMREQGGRNDRRGGGCREGLAALNRLLDATHASVRLRRPLAIDPDGRDPEQGEKIQQPTVIIEGDADRRKSVQEGGPKTGAADDGPKPAEQEPDGAG